ncbi:MAG: response regulator [Sedimentisphaerales bacterium]|nr:response regulator [Sedimentisphaerales bacterium]
MAKKILVIDDDNDFVESIVNLLEAKGYNVASASNGTDGVAKAKDNKPDLILLDVMMTTKDEGFNVARELQGIEGIKGTPVIMVTGVRKEMNLPFGFEPDETWLPVKQVLEKPVKPETLLNEVADALK